MTLYLYLYVLVPLIFLGLSLIHLSFDLKKTGKPNFTFSTKDGQLNCLSLITAAVTFPFLFTGIHNLHEEIIRDNEIARRTTDSVHKAIIVRKPSHSDTTIVVTSNLSPFLNRILANNLKKSASHSGTIHINVTFNYPTDGYLVCHAGGTLQDYAPGAQIQVKSNCGNFLIDSAFIAPFGKNRPRVVRIHLESERTRIVEKHILQICNKLKPCLL